MTTTPEFPVDLPGATGQEHALRWTAITMAVATLALGLTNATSITSWGAEQTPGPRVAQMLDRADRWREATDRAGLGMARATMHRLWKSLEDAHWPAQSPKGEERG